jgi:hypothetical protein
VLLLLTAVRFFLARHLLLVDGNSAVQGIFGLTDHQARIPAYQGLAVVSLAAAFGVAWGGFRNRAVPVFVGVAAVVFGGIVVGEIYPAAIQRFRVVPNELVRESSYIDWNLQATRAAFGLSDLERQDFQVSDLPEPTPTEIMAQFDGLPVWTPDALLTTLKSLEARFPYYEFPSLAIDRYPTPSGVLPVALAVREVAPDQITESTWVTEHLRERFLAGQGAAAADATTRTPEGRPEMLLSGIPPEVTARGAAASGLALTRPQVFISGAPQDYAVITPADSAFESPEGGPGVPGVDYPRGISIGSALRRIALAWRFRELNLLVSTEVTDQSRLVFRRQAVERVLTLAPFLRALEGAYPIVHDGRVVWMVEGFTLSSTYPLASALGAGASLGRTRYVRNSVKATVDAVTGEVVLYRTDDSDPIIDAYSRAFPSLFRPLAEMPEGLLEHIRYPAILLDAQARVLAQYHQETAAVFYGQQDVWSLAQEQSRNDLLGEYPPAYGLYRLPGDEEEGFHLTTVFVPKDRPNLTALLVARSDPERYGELLLLDIPVESQVPGPRQVEALVDQDPDISQQLSLWRQGGSQVWLGHLHVIPVGDRFLYMEPVFLAASGDAIPELRRFVVSDGRRVAMRDGLGAAVAALWGGELPGGGDLLPTEGTDPGTPAIAGSVDDALSLLEDRLRILLERLAGG